MPDSKSYDLDHTATEKKKKNKYHHGNIQNIHMYIPICIFPPWGDIFSEGTF